jgi:peptidoglycan hydrolase-like protein with peptidoglycan-binding domain
MNKFQLQKELQTLKLYSGEIDGIIGPKSKQAIIQALTMGPDTPLSAQDVQKAAARLKVTPAHIWTVWDVEASGNPFIDGRPTILFEPHVFARHTSQRYNESHPRLSSRNWNRRLYPSRQIDRYNQLVDAMALDPDAALCATSWGAFQVLGQNWRSLRAYRSSWDFALQQSISVFEQLEAFCEFVEVNGLVTHLRSNNWAAFARGYNGPAFRENRYDEKLATRFRLRSGQGA